MPTFATPEPILADIEPVVGNVRVVAGDRTETVVEVRPRDESDASDVKAANQTVVEFSGGTLSVKAPKSRPFDFSNKTRAIEVTIELPAGSRLTGSTGIGDLHGTGRLGECRYKTGIGHIQLDHTGELHLHTGVGNIVVERVAGGADLSTGSGRVHIGSLSGAGVVKNSNGATTIGAAAGSVRLRAANGDITVDRADDTVEAKTANGSVRVLDAARGTLTLETALGDVEIGIREGSAAWLDVKTRFGRVDNQMAASTGPDASTDKLEVHANTSLGDIVVHRA